MTDLFCFSALKIGGFDWTSGGSIFFAFSQTVGHMQPNPHTLDNVRLPPPTLLQYCFYSPKFVFSNVKCGLPGGNAVFPSQQLFELFLLASETIESLSGVIFLHVLAEKRWVGLLAGRAQLVSREHILARGGFKVLAAASSVAQTDDVIDG